MHRGGIREHGGAAVLDAGRVKLYRSWGMASSATNLQKPTAREADLLLDAGAGDRLRLLASRSIR